MALSVLRIEGSEDARESAAVCIARFAEQRVPFRVSAKAGSEFAEYADYYPKEVPVRLGLDRLAGPPGLASESAGP